ncbi:hypothetical protein MBLNU230_g2163t1 [Neophaeotheca triangularis]
MASKRPYADKPSFLDLPREIRDLIYRFSLNSRGPKTKSDLILPKTRQTHFFINIHSPLTLTNRQIHREIHNVVQKDVRTGHSDTIHAHIADCDFTILFQHLFSKDQNTGQLSRNAQKLLESLRKGCAPPPRTLKITFSCSDAFESADALSRLSEWSEWVRAHSDAADARSRLRLCYAWESRDARIAMRKVLRRVFVSEDQLGDEAEWCEGAVVLLGDGELERIWEIAETGTSCR